MDNSKETLPDKRVSVFLKEHHLATLSVTDGREIWSWHAFYHYNEDEALFVISSEDKTRHIQMLKSSEIKVISGAVGLETESIGLIRGVQFTALMERCDDSLLSRNRLSYLKRFPYAILKGGDLWNLKVLELKFTDNRLGFGKKLIWRRD
jgi:uncharacterized protein YhbP (UPF0306 family)